MEKIILKFIKDFSNSNKRNDYILDFKNNFICYKGCVLYKADLRMFNYDYMIKNGVRVQDFTKLLENHDKNEFDIKFDCIRKFDKINEYIYTCDDIHISLDEKLVKILDKYTCIKGTGIKNPLSFYDEYENISALILPIIKR